MTKENFKIYLIISFVVIEILSLVFNYYFVEIEIGLFKFNLNFSVVFFCLGFFIVDIIADQFSPKDANKFVYYKFYSQILFIVLGVVAIQIYGLTDTEIAQALYKSPWMILSSIVATYAGYRTMSSIMSHMKIGIYQGSSAFKRYLYSTIPGELLFSFIFTLLCFYRHTSFDELIHAFTTSAIVKVILSIVFASIMSILRFPVNEEEPENIRSVT